MRVSAIVSTYNSERFFKGCIDDLLNQTLWQQGDLEIVVINAGSTQGELFLIKEYLRQGIPITVITTMREPLYVSWNRGIRIASGEYITNANTDDRHAPDAYEKQAAYLDAHPTVGLVYADAYVTTTPNATWDSDYDLCDEPPYQEGVLQWPEYNALDLLRHCYMGQAPMWRRDLHTQAGLFDESFIIAGDYEMWLRLAVCGIQMAKLHDILGLFYWHPSQLGRDNQQHSAYESRRAILRHKLAIEAQWQPSPT